MLWAVLADTPAATLHGGWGQYLWSGKLGWWSLFLKGGPGESVQQLCHRGGSHFSASREGLSARVLERRIRPIVDPWIQEEQCGFRPGRGTVDQLYTLHRVLEGLWEEFAQPVHMCFVDLEKAFDRVPRGGILWGVLRVNDVVLLASSSQDLQHVLERFAAECEAAGMRISTSKSEAMVLDRKRVACPLRVGGEVLPQVEEFKYLGVLFTSEGKMEREARLTGGLVQRQQLCGRCTGPSVVKKELSRRQALDLPSVNPRSHPHLWS
ncbi:hypothetical protein L3Q82_010476 [Scortum barcoo]|uniref:Uncharacterized protein n=1 Tax=Scortum barcoo TaxID=214431 RepID=A0ACB8WC66_9TELE|nr:hypothetical protein L3Q82_010476 [Scortum barcoo]